MTRDVFRRSLHGLPKRYLSIAKGLLKKSESLGVEFIMTGPVEEVCTGNLSDDLRRRLKL